MIKLVIDSASDVAAAEAAANGTELVSMEVNFGGEQFLDGVDLDGQGFFEKLIASQELPKTSQINEFRWEECFKKHVDNGDEVIAIVLSSKLSGTYNSAVKAADKFGGKVRVVDSLNASLGERIIYEYALRLAAEGKSADEIVETLEKSKKRVKVLALLGTLKYLRKGGRISSLVAFVGETLNIKPVIGLVGGEVKLIGKAIGSKKGNNLLNSLITGGKGVDFSLPYTLAYSGVDDAVVKKYVEDSRNLLGEHADNVPIHIIGSTIGTHIGPGGVGMAFFEKE